MKVKIALGQMDVQVGEPSVNVARAGQLAADAAAQGAEWLILPELWSTGYDLANADQHATALDGGAFATMRDLARQHGLHIIGSCLSRQGAGAFGNTIGWFTPDGALLGDYSKIHLFRLMDEDQFLTPGDHMTLVDTPVGKAGLAICYDLRFPEIFRTYALAGASLIVLPSEWPRPRLAHWRTLLRARAIENQLFMVACNRVGTSGETTFFGHSCIIDPWGEVVVEMDDQAGIAVADIDLSTVPATRRKIPVFQDRRPDLYKLG